MQDEVSKKIAQLLQKETRKTELIVQAQEKAMSPKVKYTGEDIRQLTAELSKVTKSSGNFDSGDYGTESNLTSNMSKVRRSLRMDDLNQASNSGLKVSESVPNMKLPLQNVQNSRNIQNLNPKSPKTPTGNSLLQTSKSNIFDQSSESSANARISTKIIIPDWVTKRAHSSMTLIPSVNKQEKVKLGTLPLYEQEYELVKDLLCIFIGVAGRWINVRIDPD